MYRLLQDLRYALRQLRRGPGFTAVAVGTLALAIGAHVAVFSLVDTVFLRPLPVEDPEDLVGVYESRDGTGFHPLAFPDYLLYRDANTVFEGLAAHYSSAPLMLQTSNEPQQEINGSVVSANYFPLLGIEPALGRFFLPEEDATPRTHAVAVVSHDLWQSRLGGGKDVLGKLIKLNDTAFTVIGVAPDEFEGVEIGLPSEVWIPTMMSTVGYRWCDTFDRDCTWIEMIGRLASGRALEDAQIEMRVLSRGVREAHPSEDEGRRGLALAPLTGIEPDMRWERLRLIALLLAAVTLVVIVAGANVSGLLIARSLTRRKEIAVRSALGASRWRVVSLFLVDMLLISGAGGAGGLLVASWFGRSLAMLFPSAVPLELRLNPRVAAYAVLLAIVVGLFVGLVAGVKAARPILVTALKDSATSGRKGRPRLLGSLVIVQIAVSFALLTATGLMVRSLSAVTRVGSFDSDRLATFRLRPRLIGYGPEQAQRFTREVVRRLSRLPGVECVTPVEGLPPPFWRDGPYPVHRPGEVPDPDRAPTAWINQVGPRYFETFSLSILQGREFDERDTPDGRLVTVVNRKLATALWPIGEAVGRVLILDGDAYEVIGVTADPPEYVMEVAPPQAFLSYWQNPHSIDARIAVRTTGKAGPLLSMLSEEIRAIDSRVPVVEIETMRGRLRRGFAQTHLVGRVLGAAGGLTLFLSAVGLFGVVALSVAQRTREIAIRQALGSSRSRVVGAVVRDSMLLAGFGFVAGSAMAFAIGKAVAHYLYGVEPYDAMTFGTVTVVLGTAALLATWIPARRAARVEPMEALRGE